MILYKYLSPEIAFKVLESLRLRFTQPSLFNDPFDCRPVLEYDLNVDKLLAGLDSECPGDRPVIAALQNPQQRKMYQDLFVSEVQEDINHGIGILCLSEPRDSMLLWSYYADCHMGVAVGLDANHPFFGSPAICDYGAGKVIRVTYSRKRPTIPLTRLHPYFKFFHKSREWRHEKEWRIFRMLDEASHVDNSTPWRPVYLFDVPPDCIRSVIIGASALLSFGRRVIETVRSQKSLGHVELYESRLDQKEYKLNLIRIPI